MRQHFFRYSAVVALTAALALAGCSQDARPSVPTADRGADAPPTVRVSPDASAPAQLTEQEKGIKFARCMTEHGQKTSDPVDGEAPSLWALSTDDREVRQKAWEACRQFYPTLTYRKVEPREAEAYRKYAVCMREQGVIDGLPEVGPDGNLIEKNNYAATDSGKGPSSEFLSAHYKCRKALLDLMNDPLPMDDPERQ